MRELTYYQPPVMATITASSSGDNTIIAAPGSGRQIVISSITVQNASSTSTTAIIKFGSTSVYTAILPSQGDGVTKDMEPAWEVGNNAALVLNLSGANSHYVNVTYWIDAA